MFDADTIALMADAPSLDGLDLEELPQRLTNAYASIVATRVRLRETTEEQVLPDDVRAVTREMQRLAFTYEAFVSALPEREDRAAVAFVAGAAHHVCLLAARVGVQAATPSRLGLDAISPEVSATLLFLLAEASADAAEMAKAIVLQTDDPVETALLSALVCLANGRLRRVLDIPLPSPEQFLATEPCQQAVRSLLYLLLLGVRSLAAAMLGLHAGEAAAIPESDPAALFQRVQSLCVEPLDDLFDGEGGATYSLYPGPLHLASLLSSVAKDLSSSALVNVPSPGGLDGARWAGVMQEMAQRRPYLWRNHRQAIEAGYLEPGVSAVVSFPTGAGKSALAELKVAAALLRGVKVVFLAPTLALVDQTATALAAAFPAAEVQRERSEELLFDLDSETLPAISVMTPERCLAVLSFDREIFTDVGLLVFDECHLLHPRETDRSRRAIDAMLCVLNVTSIAPEADLLFLSAMMRNAEELAGWLQSVTGRVCLSLTLTWKPTRQVRGCVVYGASEINALRARLQEVRAAVKNKHAPAALMRELAVQPFGFFCLRQTWQSRARRDYALLPLLEDTVTLATGTTKNRNWYLTPNGNQVASNIAAATAGQRLKTLVFTQSIPLCNSAANGLTARLGPPHTNLVAEEQRLYDIAVDEAGGPERVYLEVSEEGQLRSSSTCHHGLLLPAERHLHESLFKRPDGINVLVATSTLAQGMNLPSEVVIIGGDSRFDAEANRMGRLEAHELLNAAGRAGRAGENSYGFVLVVPSKVVHFDDQANQIHHHWADLRAIFSQSDQCLDIDDPLGPLLDQIHLATAAPSEMARYLLSRLPIGADDDETGPDGPARVLLGRSLAVYRARVRNNQNWIDTRIEAAITARRADPDTPEVLTWADRLAAATGVPVAAIRSLGEAIVAVPPDADATVLDWRTWVFHWLMERPALVPQLIRRESLEGPFGNSYKALEDNEARGNYVLPILDTLLAGWMAGHTLAALERTLGVQEHVLGKCERAREFVLRIVPELAYIFGLPAQVFRARNAEAGEPDEPPLAMATLSSCVREGLDQVDKLALRRFRDGRPSRVAVHREFARIEPFLTAGEAQETFVRAMDRVREAVEICDQLG